MGGVPAWWVRSTQRYTKSTARSTANASSPGRRSSAVSSLTSKLNQKGNVKVEIKTYTGTGSSGQSSPNSLTFSGKPVLFFIGGSDGSSVGYYVRGSNTLWVRPGNSVYMCDGSWSGNTYSWWNTYANFQLNQKNETYTVVAYFNCSE